ncbi:MAG: long-chain fatty acid--CoA ligase [Planctomycetes bacterium]|nr:long-chain fatty acid--CoA ligase [Planctomycetota bacterium]
MPNADDSVRDAVGGIPGRLLQSVSRYRGRALLGHSTCRAALTRYEEIAELVEQIAAGFQAIGVSAGMRVALIADNSDAWLLTDLALLSLGAADVPRGADASVEDVEFCVLHGACSGAVLGSIDLLPKLGKSLDSLRFVVVLHGAAGTHTALDQLLEIGKAHLAAEPNCVKRARAEVRDNTLATLIYTSGTTGNPKGVMLSHGNMLHNLRAVPAVLHLLPGERYLSFLPVWHSFERILDYVVLDCGLELHYGTRRTLRDDFQRVKPNLVAAVPRVFETFVDAALAKMAALKTPKRIVAHSLLRLSSKRNAWRRKLHGCAATDTAKVPKARGALAVLLQLGCALLTPAQRLADALIYAGVRRALGGAARLMISGGGALQPRVDEFLNNAGLTLLNGYGLTESSPVICVRLPEHVLLGTAGPPLPDTEVRVVDDAGRGLPHGQRGVIHARGPQIMQGYWKNPEATAAALLPGGWLNTGDLGQITQCGALMITGRVKDTIVLSGGENVEPEPIETRLLASPWIADAIVVGHARKILAVLIVPDFAALRRHLGRNDADADLAADPRTRDLLKAEVQQRTGASAGLRSFEQVGRFHVLTEPFRVEDGTLTATLKKRRNVIEQRYAQEIAALFGGA